MYYQKESKNFNNDYYNSYVNHSTKNSDTSDLLTTIIKVLAIGFLLTFIIFGYVFVSNQYYLSQLEAKSIQKAQQIKEPIIGVNTIESVTDSLERQEGKLNSEDITKIVQMVMLKMTKLKQQESKNMSDDNYAKKLISESNKEDRIDLKPIKHNNKVVIINNNDKKRGNLSLLNDEILNSLESKKEKQYTKSISKELKVRSDAMRIIIVKKGDTLSDIAHKAYGNVSDYKKIYEANPEVIKNEDKIFTGQKIRIPK